MLLPLFFLDGRRGVAQSGLGLVTVASWGCFQSFPGGLPLFLAAIEMGVGAVAVEIESDYEPELPCTVVETQGIGRVRHPGGGSQEGSGRARARALCV